MNSLILQTISRLLLGWLLFFSLWILLRGHNAAGGGFIGGLLAASAFALYLLAYDKRHLLAIIFFPPLTWLCLGLFFLLLSGLWGIFMNESFLTGIWIKGTPWINSPLLFDIGIYLMVCFSILSILIEQLEQSQ
ncbi:Na(+)/H(+) antiporter subunit B [Legionella israelensis]|uniref:MnhB domain-containing protein n=1 Tax=Legionella israelensis TaxID=454 RepID=UPI00117CABB1|nr:MnhB domain-containing protein [Legionella israelensis]QDP73357.1 Na(+)/H(+) antiporter subunit B [Legionella israelensis]